MINLESEKTAGFEVLTRGPEGKLFSAPNLFGAAEHYDLSEELNYLCLKKGLKWGQKLPEKYFLSLNIDSKLLHDDILLDFLNKTKYTSLHSRLYLEIIEHMPLFLLNKIKGVINKIGQLGINFALDDTGCGFFDLDTVKMVKPSLVKLCITVTNRLLDGEEVSQDIIATINRIKEISPESIVLAEGIEQKQQLEILKQCQVDMGQGYYFARPRPAKKVLADV